METQHGSRHKLRPLQFADLANYRRLRAENQSQFWSRFGVTQSGGSRYESGRAVPKPVRLLMKLYAEGKISDADLAAAAGKKARGKKAA